MTDYVVCAIHYARGEYNIVATQTIRTATGLCTACDTCADDYWTAQEAHWEHLAARWADA